MKLKNVFHRIHQIRSYTALAPTIESYPKLVALGIARGHPFDSSTIIAKVGRRLFPRLEFSVRSLGATRVVLNPSDGTHMIIFDEVVLNSAYDFQLPFVPDAIFDCGGHIGLFMLSAAHAYPNVPITVFEPNPRNLPYIHEHVRLNGLKVEVVEAAVSTADGEAWFDDGPSFAGQLSAKPQDGQAKPDGAVAEVPSRYKVKIIDFPRLFKERNPNRPLLKIDIEGEELNLIPALIDLLPATCGVYFETHGGEPAWERMSGLFQAHGFVVTRRRTMDRFVDGLALR